jgi:hypothetical protein
VHWPGCNAASARPNYRSRSDAALPPSRSRHKDQSRNSPLEKTKKQPQIFIFKIGVGFNALTKAEFIRRAGLMRTETGWTLRCWPGMLWAGSATISSPIADTVEAAYLSGLRAATQARHILDAG